MTSPSPDRPDQSKALVSWKEIACYLDRAERTVKRWERDRGLPVHRIPGGERGNVFAYPGELADWLKGKAQELDGDGPSDGDRVPGDDARPAKLQTVAPVETVPLPASPRRRWTLNPKRVVAWLAPLALTAAFIFYLRGGHTDSHVTAVDVLNPSNAGAPNLAPDSVAVLPFSTVGGEPNSDYLSDGITETLIDNLAHIPQLRVRSRDSVFRLKGKDIDVQEAGRELGVPVVVSGRMLTRAGNIEVSVELTNVRDNTETWGKRYSAKSSDLLRLQVKVADDIAEQLRFSLSDAEKQKVTRQGTQNMDAYTLYLKGRYGWKERNRANLDASIDYFDQAIARDPKYAVAYSALADDYSVLPFFGENPAEVFPKASAAARKALQLDPTMAHPHAILGSLEMEYDWDFSGGEAEFRKSFALDPNDATAHQWFAESLGMIGGREQEALAEIDLAHALDPTSLVIRRAKGSVLVAARRYDDAIAVCQQLLVQNPTYSVADDCLSYAYWGKRMYPQFLEHWAASLRLTHSPNDSLLADGLERGFRSGGWRGAITEAANYYLHQRQIGYASAYTIARLYADLGDKEKAFEWLGTAYREHDFLLRELNTDFGMDPLRSDPRFAVLVGKVGLPKLH